MTDQEMQQELDDHFKKVNDIIEKFYRCSPGKNLEDFDTEGLLDSYVHIEKHTVKDLINLYINDFNSNVDYYGDGFEYYDEDMTINILYRNGKTIYVSPQWWDGSKKIPISGIDTIVIDSGWGDAVAGKHYRVFNAREETDYGKYGYRSLQSRYDDWDDIRVEIM